MDFDNPQTIASIRDLNDQLEKARNAYYVLAAPIMTDAEYDVLEGRLRGLIKANPWLANMATALMTVGSDLTATNGLPRVKHIRPMLSIENQYKKDDVLAWALSLPKGTTFDVEPKRDGTSNENRYLNGQLKASLTRGKGDEGEDQTAQVKALQSIPQFLVHAPLLDVAPDINIRGELVMRDGELDRLNKEAAKNGTKTYASTRNLTAGTMKQKDLSVVASREILFMPWDVYSPSNDAGLPDSNFERMRLLEQAGFPKYDGIHVTNSDNLVKAIDDILALNAKSEIRADGVVIKVDSHKLRQQLGVESKFTNWMTCFKPQSASGTTYLREIIWQMGRTGKISPVAICDPVVLAGASVTRASLNNETWIATMGLTIGSKVEMLRSGDVIPQIVKVLDDTGTPIVPPTFCPECNSKLVIYTEAKSGITTRWCENDFCPGRVRDLFTFIGSRDVLEIDGLADDMSTKLVKENYARNVGELFTFQTEALAALNQLSDKYGEAGEDKFAMAMAKKGFSITILKMLRSMETAKKANWDKWIAALGIPFVGRTLGKVLAKQLQLTPDDMVNLPAKLEAAVAMKVENMGDVKGDILRKWALDPVNRGICKALFDAGVRPVSLVSQVAAGVGQPLVGVSFIITGEFDEDREELTKKLESLGAVSKSSVSKNCTHFIVGESAGKSKLAKYDELVAKGCKIEKVGKDWLVKTLSDAGLEMKGSNFAVEEA